MYISKMDAFVMKFLPCNVKIGQTLFYLVSVFEGWKKLLTRRERLASIISISHQKRSIVPENDLAFTEHEPSLPTYICTVNFEANGCD